MNDNEINKKYDFACSKFNEVYQSYQELVFLKNKCINELYELEFERRKKLTELNEIKSQYHKYIQTQENISGIHMQEQLESDLNGVNKEFEEASDFFKSIAISDDSQINLASHILSEDNSKDSFSFLSKIFSGFNIAQTNIGSKIEDLEKKIRTTENFINEIDREINSKQNEIESYNFEIKKMQSNVEACNALKNKLYALL